MAIVVVGGHSRNVGKTSVVAGLIAAMPERAWLAVKITQYGHGICSANGEPCDCVTADHASAITEELGKLAAEDGVFLSGAHYDAKDSDVPDVQQIAISANLTGPYEKVVKFINDLERDRMLFIVNNVSLVEQSGGTVHLAVQVNTYLRRQS